jgi:hypothetical protein
LTDVFQTIQCVSGKAADGLCNDYIDITSHTLVNHTVEFLTLFGVGAGYTVICKNTCQSPVRMTFYVGRIMFNLGIIAGGLLIAVS